MASADDLKYRDYIIVGISMCCVVVNRRWQDVSNKKDLNES